MSAIASRRDEGFSLRARLLRIGARIQQRAHGLDMSFPDGEVKRGGVSGEIRIAIEQTPKLPNIADARGENRFPDITASTEPRFAWAIGRILVWLDWIQARFFAAGEMAFERGPSGETLLERDGVLHIAKARGCRSAGMCAGESCTCVLIAGAKRLEPTLGLLLVIFERAGHDNLPSVAALDSVGAKPGVR